TLLSIFFYCSLAPPHLPSFPTRRSSDLSIVITSNDFAGAWALDESNRPIYPTVPGGEVQREMAFRAGVNIVMYALTGNYKADQRSEEHTSELQSLTNLVCRLLLEKKKNI